MKIAILLVFLLFSIFTFCDSSTNRRNKKGYVQLEQDKSPEIHESQTEATAHGMTSISPTKDIKKRKNELDKIVKKKQGNGKGKSTST
uniref:Uncharacterized protein n=1 Tax=Meloidogyne enterolobii TaxID=390850 RepID=A0A6V7WLK8_MELEN|nr:unnamed protein product [Meloidogyne enterolobii]